MGKCVICQESLLISPMEVKAEKARECARQKIDFAKATTGTIFGCRQRRPYCGKFNTDFCDWKLKINSGNERSVESTTSIMNVPHIQGISAGAVSDFVVAQECGHLCHLTCLETRHRTFRRIERASKQNDPIECPVCGKAITLSRIRTIDFAAHEGFTDKFKKDIQYLEMMNKELEEQYQIAEDKCESTEKALEDILPIVNDLETRLEAFESETYKRSLAKKTKLALTENAKKLRIMENHNIALAKTLLTMLKSYSPKVIAALDIVPIDLIPTLTSFKFFSDDVLRNFVDIIVPKPQGMAPDVFTLTAAIKSAAESGEKTGLEGRFHQFHQELKNESKRKNSLLSNLSSGSQLTYTFRQDNQNETEESPVELKSFDIKSTSSKSTKVSTEKIKIKKVPLKKTARKLKDSARMRKVHLRFDKLARLKMKENNITVPEESIQNKEESNFVMNTCTQTSLTTSSSTGNGVLNNNVISNVPEKSSLKTHNASTETEENFLKNNEDKKEDAIGKESPKEDIVNKLRVLFAKRIANANGASYNAINQPVKTQKGPTLSKKSDSASPILQTIEVDTPYYKLTGPERFPLEISPMVSIEKVEKADDDELFSEWALSEDIMETQNNTTIRTILPPVESPKITVENRVKLYENKLTNKMSNSKIPSNNSSEERITGQLQHIENQNDQAVSRPVQDRNDRSREQSYTKNQNDRILSKESRPVEKPNFQIKSNEQHCAQNQNGRILSRESCPSETPNDEIKSGHRSIENQHNQTTRECCPLETQTITKESCSVQTQDQDRSLTREYSPVQNKNIRESRRIENQNDPNEAKEPCHIENQSDETVKREFRASQNKHTQNIAKKSHRIEYQNEKSSLVTSENESDMSKLHIASEYVNLKTRSSEVNVAQIQYEKQIEDTRYKMQNENLPQQLHCHSQWSTNFEEINPVKNTLSNVSNLNATNSSHFMETAKEIPTLNNNVSSGNMNMTPRLPENVKQHEEVKLIGNHSLNNQRYSPVLEDTVSKNPKYFPVFENIGSKNHNDSTAFVDTDTKHQNYSQAFIDQHSKNQHSTGFVDTGSKNQNYTIAYRDTLSKIPNQSPGFEDTFSKHQDQSQVLKQNNIKVEKCDLVKNNSVGFELGSNDEDVHNTQQVANAVRQARVPPPLIGLKTNLLETKDNSHTKSIEAFIRLPNPSFTSDSSEEKLCFDENKNPTLNGSNNETPQLETKFDLPPGMYSSCAVNSSLNTNFENGSLAPCNSISNFVSRECQQVQQENRREEKTQNSYNNCPEKENSDSLSIQVNCDDRNITHSSQKIPTQESERQGSEGFLPTEKISDNLNSKSREWSQSKPISVTLNSDDSKQKSISNHPNIIPIIINVPPNNYQQQPQSINAEHLQKFTDSSALNSHPSENCNSRRLTKSKRSQILPVYLIRQSLLSQASSMDSSIADEEVDRKIVAKFIKDHFKKEAVEMVQKQLKNVKETSKEDPNIPKTQELRSLPKIPNNFRFVPFAKAIPAGGDPNHPQQFIVQPQSGNDRNQREFIMQPQSGNDRNHPQQFIIQQQFGNDRNQPQQFVMQQQLGNDRNQPQKFVMQQQLGNDLNQREFIMEPQMGNNRNQREQFILQQSNTHRVNVPFQREQIPETGRLIQNAINSPQIEHNREEFHNRISESQNYYQENIRIQPPRSPKMIQLIPERNSCYDPYAPVQNQHHNPHPQPQLFQFNSHQPLPNIRQQSQPRPKTNLVQLVDGFSNNIPSNQQYFSAPQPYYLNLPFQSQVIQGNHGMPASKEESIDLQNICRWLSPPPSAATWYENQFQPANGNVEETGQINYYENPMSQGFGFGNQSFKEG